MLNNSNLYKESFYKTRHDDTYYAANKILSIVLSVLPKIKTAVDVGCGVGTWLCVLEKKGVKNITGIDGSWVPKKNLKIILDNFIEQDLENLKINHSYDLAISLEVAEHINSNNADSFVAQLANNSNYILFSAAHPGQGGVGHINEQYMDYWSGKFERHNFIGIDIVRKKIFNDEKIPSWYKKNTILFVNKQYVHNLTLNNDISSHIIPELYNIPYKQLMYPGIFTGFQSLVRGIKKKIKNID
jgi:cyclopropane fatty-acyl-phospholipid synthase-like methyltransferase